MHKVLVTGATGFIGQQLVKHLLARNCTVRVLVRDKVKAARLPADVEFFYGKLEQPESLQSLCKDIDTVFHLAGHAHAWAEQDAVASKKHRAINLKGTQAILAEAEASGVTRFVYFSTVKAVADSSLETDEDFLTMPNSAYGLAKREAEACVLAAKLPHVCVLRPTLVYGPLLKGNLASMLKAIDKGYFLPVPEVFNVRSMIGIDDLCRAAILAAEQVAAHHQVYIVSDGVAYSTRAIYDLMRHFLNKPPRKWAIPFKLLTLLANMGDLIGKGLKRRFVFDSQALCKLLGSAHYNSTRICAELGFKPEQTLSSALPEIVNHYRHKKS